MVGYYWPTTVVCARARRLRKLLFVYIFFLFFALNFSGWPNVVCRLEEQF